MFTNVTMVNIKIKPSIVQRLDISEMECGKFSTGTAFIITFYYAYGSVQKIRRFGFFKWNDG